MKQFNFIKHAYTKTTKDIQLKLKVHSKTI